MKTVMEALQWANATLRERHMDHAGSARIDSPMLDAELLLAHVLRIPKSRLFTALASPLEEAQIATFRSYIERRINHEPVAYITEKKAFFGRTFAVSPAVLIPRPATELLIEKALEAASAHETERTIFADIGTGSGAIAITLAAETHIPAIGTDLSNASLELAKRNARELGAADAVEFRQGDLLDPLITIFRTLKNKKVSLYKHLILCANLPYLSNEQWDNAQQELSKHEPKHALVAGFDGLDAYRDFLKQLRAARNILPFYVTLLIEMDPSQKQKLSGMVRNAFANTEPEVFSDLEGHARLIVASV